MMDDDFHIASNTEMVRYLCIFHRWLQATQEYIRTHDRDGLGLSAWIADTLHNVPSMLWRYNPEDEWNGPVQIAAWMERFPQIVREEGAPQRIVDDCDAIFSPENAATALDLQSDLSDLDLAPPEKMTAYLDLIFHACLEIRWRPGEANPWDDKSAFWQGQEAATTAAMSGLADVLVAVPHALVHWNQFDDQGFTERARTLWNDWPWAYGLGRLRCYRTVERLRPLWHQWLSTNLQEYVADAPLHWLVTQYAQPWRAYHTLAHIERMFDICAEVAKNVPVSDGQALALSIWFHDAVYDPKRHDNEARSAEEARLQLAPLGMAEASLERVQRMILATARHERNSEDVDTALLLDLDLAILGSEPEEYAAYAHAIRQEYSFVAEQEYRSARSQVLRRFLQRSQIFLTEPMWTRYEERARQNVALEIAALDGMG